MAPTTSPKPGKTKEVVTKLPTLPKNARVRKRPILHPPIPSIYTNARQQKVVYISTGTPFISAVKRVRKLLEQADARAMGISNIVTERANDERRLQTLIEKMDAVRSRKPEEVVIKGTNRAIERVLNLGLYFQSQADCEVQIRTGSVGVVDDIVERKSRAQGSSDPQSEQETPGELPESRVRKLSVVEVAVTRK